MIPNSPAILGIPSPREILEDQLKKYWELLGHEGLGYTEIRIIKKLDNSVLTFFVDNFKDFSQIIFTESPLSREKNIFVGVNPRVTKSGKAQDVNYLCNLVLDLDLKTTIKPTDLNYDNIINSGRGYHIYFPIKSLSIGKNLNEITRQLKAFTTYHRELNKDLFKVDHVFDVSRVMRCPGTWNMKDKSKCEFLDLRKPIIRFDYTDIITIFPTVTNKEVINETAVLRRFKYVENKLIIKSDYPSPSEKVFHFVNQLITFGFSKNEINFLINYHVIGTKGKSYEQDIQRIFNKVEETLEIKPLDLYFDSYESELGKRELGFMTGIPSLDGKTGGFKRKELVAVAARSSIGKTTFSMNLVEEFLTRDYKVLMFPTEMSFSSLIDKLVSLKSKIPLVRFRQNTLEEKDYKKIRGIREELKKMPFIVSEIPSPTLHEIQTIVSKCRPDVVVLDYLERVSIRGQDYRISFEEFIRGLKNIAKNNNCNMIVTSQLNRMGNNNNPDITTIRGSDVLEHESDLVIMLSTEDRMQVERLIHLKIAKNRYGELGYIPLTFSTECGTIKERV